MTNGIDLYMLSNIFIALELNYFIKVYKMGETKWEKNIMKIKIDIACDFVHIEK